VSASFWQQDGTLYLIVTYQSGRDRVTQRYSFDTGRRLDDNDVHDVRVFRDGQQVRQIADYNYADVLIGWAALQSCSSA